LVEQVENHSVTSKPVSTFLALLTYSPDDAPTVCQKMNVLVAVKTKNPANRVNLQGLSLFDLLSAEEEGFAPTPNVVIFNILSLLHREVT